MRKVVFYHIVSLDGFAFEEDDWFDDGGPELFANIGRVIETQDDIVMGRGTYDYWVGYWPTSDVQPFADFINSTLKHVITSSKPDQEWANTTLVSTPVTDYLTDLKQRPGGDIGLHGSIDLARSLLGARMIDELRLIVAPAVVGKGRRVFEGDVLQKLELLDVTHSPKGTLFLRYRCPSATTTE
ncbi:dihydrofolate reductase family protein [Actinomadura alba]|uniref:Dihydrofolate reductase n=1 Tax=Actinomadura alba TaxID=406431 RepID=A0ABR7LQZ8_9ACTN|nr:dihydrofolate reductase family protein [Actinomadura alba]MBC6467273.1 dihydrofolate reductase [Actinomadura alba]